MNIFDTLPMQLFDGDPTKLVNSRFHSQFIRPNIRLICLKIIFFILISNYIGKQLLLKNIFISTILKKLKVLSSLGLLLSVQYA